MKVANTLKSFWRKLLKNPVFWETFPEYKDIKLRLEKKELKITCCSIPQETITVLSQLILDNPEKWKNYLKVEKINIFIGTKVVSV